MKILVTGCAGFIGWKVSELLLAEGNSISGIDNFNTAYDTRLKELRLKQLLHHPMFTFHLGDICDFKHMEDLSQKIKFEAVINMAARAGVRQSIEDPRVYYETNVVGTLNLLELCRKYGVRKFILASTSSLYGVHNQLPFREDANTDRPLSPYASSKKAAETLCHVSHRLYQLNVVVLRYFTVYGPAGRPDMSIFRFIKWIAEGEPLIVYGDGSQKGDFTYVEDIARGTLPALHFLSSSRLTPHPSPIYEIINLGSDRPVSLNHVIATLEGFLEKKAEIVNKPTHPADVLATWADISKAHKLLGWEPEVSLENGLGEAVKWYLENRDWAREIILP